MKHVALFAALGIMAGCMQATTAQAATGTPECKIGQLAVGITGENDASGHRGRILLFTNTGTTACFLQGYPGVAALDADGDQVAQAARTLHGYLGGITESAPQRITLAAGATASAGVEAMAYTDDGTGCTAYAGLLATPPDETHSVQLLWGNDGCADLQIHPVVSGTTGNG